MSLKNVLFRMFSLRASKRPFCNVKPSLPIAKSLPFSEGKQEKTEFLYVKPVEKLKQMESDFDLFFQSHPRTLTSFKLLIKICTAKDEFKKALSAFDRIHEIGLKPDLSVYSLMISAAAKRKDVETAERFFREGIRRGGHTNAVYSAMINVYSFTSQGPQPDKAEELFAELVAYGTRPDIATYTSLINCLLKARQNEKCVKYFEEMPLKPDKILLNLMLKVYKNSTPSQGRADFLNSFLSKVDRLTCIDFNCLMNNYLSNPELAEEALNLFFLMIEKRVKPDSGSISLALYACAKLGNVEVAKGIADLSQRFGIDVHSNKFIMVQLLSVYGSFLMKDYILRMKNLPGACSEEERSKLVSEAKQLYSDFLRDHKELVQVHFLNAIFEVEIFATNFRIAKENILPLFEELKIEKDSNTFLWIIVGLFQIKQFKEMTETFLSIANKSELLKAGTLNFMAMYFLKQKDYENLAMVVNISIQSKVKFAKAIWDKMKANKSIPTHIHILLEKKLQSIKKK